MQMRPSWAMLQPDAASNPGELPSQEMRLAVLEAVRAGWRARASTLDPSHYCQLIALLFAELATEATGTTYRAHSGEWCSWLPEGPALMHGRGAFFHTWVMAGHPGERVEVVDPQRFFGDPPLVVWGWAAEVLEEFPIAFRSDARTTARVLREAQTNRFVLLYRGALLAEARAALAARRG